MRAYRVTKVVDNVHQEKYFVHGEWRRRDQLLVVPGVDMRSRAVVVAKHRKRKKQDAGAARARQYFELPVIRYVVYHGDLR